MAEELRTSCALYAYSAAARSCSEGVAPPKALRAEAPRAAAGSEPGEKPAKTLRADRTPSADAATTEGPAGQKAAKAEAPAKKHKPKPPRLTHFFALRVAPDALRDTAGAVQTALVAADKDLAKCVISPEKFHVTLGLLSLGDPDARQRAEAALLEAARAPPPTVVFPGLDSFGDRVLFAKVEDASDDGRLAAVAAASKRALEAHGFPNQPDFAPHVTLAKTSKARTRRRLKILKTAWAALADAPVAGTQTLGTIELMAMAGDDGNGGYPVVATAALGGGELVVAPPSDGATAELPASPSRSKRARWKRNARARRAAASEKTV